VVVCTKKFEGKPIRKGKLESTDSGPRFRRKFKREVKFTHRRRRTPVKKGAEIGGNESYPLRSGTPYKNKGKTTRPVQNSRRPPKEHETQPCQPFIEIKEKI